MKTVDFTLKWMGKGMTYEGYNTLAVVWVRINVMRNTRHSWAVQTAIVPSNVFERTMVTTLDRLGQ